MFFKPKILSGLISSLLCLAMAAAAFASPIAAKTQSEDVPETAIWNTSEFGILEEDGQSLYESDETDSDSASDSFEGAAVYANAEYTLPTVCDSNEEAGKGLKTAMLQRRTSVQVNVSSNLDMQEMIRQAFIHDRSNGKAGDYLSRNLMSWKCVSYGNYYTGQIYYYIFTFEYKTTAAQEAEGDTLYASVLSAIEAMSFENAYDRVKNVMDWMDRNLNYDYQAAVECSTNPDSTRVKEATSAYGVLKNRRGVCDGFSQLMYRLLLDLNIDCRIILGSIGAEKHAWVIVPCGQYWYNCDPTNYSRVTGYGLFTGSRSYLGVREYTENAIMPADDFTSNEFHKKYPMDTRNASRPASDSGIVLYRLFNPETQEHLYTADKNEYAYLGEHGWQQEGPAWRSPSYSSEVVYRLYNPSNGDHHYTTDANEKQYLADCTGWEYEGPGWFSDSKQRVSVYRLYNQSLKGPGSHLYTLDVNEFEYLQTIGWADEGIAWYAMAMN